MIFLFLFQISSSTIVGIDLGSDSIKVAVGSRNNPVHLFNELYPNIFAFGDKSNWTFGDSAIEYCHHYPDSCIQDQKLPLDDKIYIENDHIKGYQIVALLLKQIIQNVKKSENIVDDIRVVVAIPPSMTLREKSYLYSALTIADINCTQFVTSTYAPIEVYVNEHKDNSQNSTLFIDIGHNGVRVSGFEYDGQKIVQTFGQYDDKIGGKSIDDNLFKLIIEKYQIEQDEYQKNRFILLSEIRKAREVLSSSTKASFIYNSEEITITREDIDSCCNEIKFALSMMIHTLKNNKKRNLLKSGSVQLLGGCSRIVCLQEYIKNLLPNINYLNSLNAISAVCMGACYIANDEIPSNVQVHESLVTSSVILKFNEDVTNLFTNENTGSYSPVVRLSNVDHNSLFRIVDVNDNDQDFRDFTINIPNKNANDANNNMIELGFTLNYYLMPVLGEPLLIDQNNQNNQIPLSLDYKSVGWEIHPDQLEQSKLFINSLNSATNQNSQTEEESKPIEGNSAKNDQDLTPQPNIDNINAQNPQDNFNSENNHRYIQAENDQDTLNTQTDQENLAQPNQENLAQPNQEENLAQPNQEENLAQPNQENINLENSQRYVQPRNDYYAHNTQNNRETYNTHTNQASIESEAPNAINNEINHYAQINDELQSDDERRLRSLKSENVKLNILMLSIPFITFLILAFCHK